MQNAECLALGIPLAPVHDENMKALSCLLFEISAAASGLAL